MKTEQKTWIVESIDEQEDCFKILCEGNFSFEIRKSTYDGPLPPRAYVFAKHRLTLDCIYEHIIGASMDGRRLYLIEKSQLPKEVIKDIKIRTEREFETALILAQVSKTKKRSRTSYSHLR